MAFRKIFLLMVCASLLIHHTALATAEDELAWVKHKVLILASSRDYQVALQTAKSAQQKLNIPLDLRKLSPFDPQKSFELTFDKNVCLSQSLEYPCYMPRTQGETPYVSIESSNHYDGMAQNYFIVVAHVTLDDDTSIKTHLKSVQNHFKDAYIKTVKIYLGYLH